MAKKCSHDLHAYRRLKGIGKQLTNPGGGRKKNSSTKKYYLFYKTPANLIIRVGDPEVKPGKPCVVGIGKHATRRGLLLKKFSVPTSDTIYRNVLH